MRREKIYEPFVSGFRREVDLVDKAGKRRSCREGRDERRTAAASKTGDAQVRLLIGETKAEAFPWRGAIAGQTEPGGFEDPEILWPSPPAAPRG